MVSISYLGREEGGGEREGGVRGRGRGGIEVERGSEGGK